MKNNCDNVISIKQYGSTCWFNSILMALLYSDESRKLLLKKSKKWNKKIKLYKTLKYILENKYLRTDNIYHDYQYFDKIRPEYILKELYKYNNKKFWFDPNKYKNGFKSALYIRKIYKLLGVKVLYLDLDIINKNLYYSLFNNMILNKYDIGGKITLTYNIKSYSTIQKKFINPDVIILNLVNNLDPEKYPIWYKNNDDKFSELINLNDNFNYENNEYLQDSVLLTNYNSKIGGHSIVGITCKNNKYVYNGWSRTTIDKNIINKISNNGIDIPCELMKFNWDVKKNNDFCLNSKKCILDKKNIKNLCFSFDKGNREIIYVKKNKDNQLNIITKKCEDDKVINPLTNRCIKVKSDKKCKDGKVINPLTNRCIKKKG